MSNIDDMVGCGDFLSDGGSRKVKDKSYRGNASESKSAKTNKRKHEQMKARTTLCKQEYMKASKDQIQIKEEQTKQATMIKSKQKLMKSSTSKNQARNKVKQKNKQKQEQPYAIKNK